MGNPVIFSGRRSKLLTADGILKSDGSINDYNGTIDLITNGHAEVNTTGWTVSKNTVAGARPDSGFVSGSTNITWTRNTTSPLAGVGDFVFTKDAVNRQGEQVYTTFTVPTNLKAKVLQIEFDYMVGSGTFAAGSSTTDSDIVAYIYDVTNGVFIEPSSIKLFSNSTTLSDKFIANFQTSATGTSYRLILHTATSSASAYTVRFKNISVKPCSYVYGATTTAWKAYTPTFTGFGTVTGVNFESRRDGDELQVRGTFTTGTTTATEARISLGYAGVDGNVTTKSTLPTLQLVGAMKQGAALSTTDFQDRQVYAEASKSYVTFGASYSTYSTGLLKGNGNGVAASTTTQSLYFSVPIQGWEASTQQSDGYDGREISFSANTSTTAASASTPFIYTNVVSNKGGGYNVANGKFTAPTQGTYFFRVTHYTGATLPEAQFYLNGAMVNRGPAQPSAATPGTATYATPMNAGDTMEIRPSGAATATGDGTLNNFSGFKISAPTTISATELVAVSVNGSTTTAAGSATTISWLNKTTDTHGAFNSNEFIVPIAGWYIVDLNVRHNGGAGLAVNQVSLGYIQIDTGGGYSTVRQGFKFVENTGVASYSNHAHYEEYLKAGTKIRFQHETTIGTPTISVSGTDTYASIVKK